jgi:O-antigen ligase
MNIYNKIESFLPYFLPLLILFSRTTTDIVVTTISILFLIKSFHENEFNWLSYKWVKVLIFFFLYLVLINTPLSINPLESLFYSFGFLRWPIFALAIGIWIFNNENSYKKFLMASFVFGSIFIADIWYQFIINENGILGISSNDHTGRLSIPFTNNVFPARIISYFTFFTILIIYYLNLASKNKQNLYFIFSVLFIGFLSALITGERMAILIFFSSILLLQIPLIFNHKNKIILFNFFLFFIILLVFFLEPKVAERSFFSIIKKLENFWSSDYGVVFLSSIEKWRNNIFFGSGLHQFKLVEPIYGYGIFKDLKIYHAHNLPLNLLVETGIFGFLIFYSCIFYIIQMTYSKLKGNILLLFLALVLLYISFFPVHTHFKFSHNWINAYSWLSVGFLISISNLYEKNNKN